MGDASFAGGRARGLTVGGIILWAVLFALPAAGACPPAPNAACKIAGAARFAVYNNLDKDSKDQLAWKWAKGEVLSNFEVGDPIGQGTTYSLCLYTGSAQALLAEVPLPQGGGWKDLNSGGFGFNNPKLDGVRFVSIKPGEAGKTSFAVKGKGETLPDPPLPFEPPVTVQLISDTLPLCLQTQFADADAKVNTETRYKAKARAFLPVPPGTIPPNDACNISGDDGSVATQVGAQMRRSGTEWATTCLAQYGAAGVDCETLFPGQTSYSEVPLGVPSLICPGDAYCDSSLGRVEWHAEDKFSRKCTLDQWSLVWGWIQKQAGDAAPPDCDPGTFAPDFWGVYSCYERHYVRPLIENMLDKLRYYESASASMTPACEAAIAGRMWWRLASDWIRFGNDVCYDGYHDTEVKNDCAIGTAPMIDEATWDAWCDEFSAFLRPVYEGVRAASGKPY